VKDRLLKSTSKQNRSIKQVFRISLISHAVKISAKVKVLVEKTDIPMMRAPQTGSSEVLIYKPV